MNKPKPMFSTLKDVTQSQGIPATLDLLIKTLRENHEYHQLFEALKMQVRHRLGLPLLYNQRPESLDSQVQLELEEGLLKACSEVGQALVRAGKLREGWVYLQPAGDRDLNQKLIADYPVTDDNFDEVIDVSLMQMAAPSVGYELVLKRYGTCNAITSFDSSAHAMDVATRQALATLLTQHLYSELRGNMVGYLKDAGGTVTDESAKVVDLFRANKKLLADAGPMTDSTHMSSAMRIGRCIEDRAVLQMLAEIAEYGCQLAEPFHFPGDPPFEKTYRDHLTFYRALVVEDQDRPEVQEAIQYFDQKSRDSRSDENNPVPDEVFVDLLFRLGKRQQAIDASLERLAHRPELSGIAPSVYQIAETSEEYSTLEKHYQSKEDFLGFAVSVMLRKDAESPSR